MQTRTCSSTSLLSGPMTLPIFYHHRQPPYLLYLPQCFGPATRTSASSRGKRGLCQIYVLCVLRIIHFRPTSSYFTPTYQFIYHYSLHHPLKFWYTYKRCFLSISSHFSFLSSSPPNKVVTWQDSPILGRINGCCHFHPIWLFYRFQLTNKYIYEHLRICSLIESLLRHFTNSNSIRPRRVSTYS